MDSLEEEEEIDIATIKQGLIFSSASGFTLVFRSGKKIHVKREE